MAGRTVATAIQDENRTAMWIIKCWRKAFSLAAGEAGRDEFWAEIAENGRFRGKRD